MWHGEIMWSVEQVAGSKKVEMMLQIRRLGTERERVPGTQVVTSLLHYFFFKWTPCGDGRGDRWQQRNVIKKKTSVKQVTLSSRMTRTSLDHFYVVHDAFQGFTAQLEKTCGEGKITPESTMLSPSAILSVVLGFLQNKAPPQWDFSSFLFGFSTRMTHPLGSFLVTVGVGLEGARTNELFCRRPIGSTCSWGRCTGHSFWCPWWFDGF